MSHRLCQRFVGRARGVLDVERDAHGVAAGAFVVGNIVRASRWQERKRDCERAALHVFLGCSCNFFHVVLILFR